MWTVYTIHVRPTALRNPGQFAQGTVKRVVDYATRAQIPPEGMVVRVKSRDIERSWDRNEKDGDVEITMAPEWTPWGRVLAQPQQPARVEETAASEKVTP